VIELMSLSFIAFRLALTSFFTNVVGTGLPFGKLTMAFETDRITSAQGKRMPDRPQASNRERRLVMLRSSRIRGLKFSN